jgi:ornithine carbamoyltransferase
MQIGGERARIACAGTQLRSRPFLSFDDLTGDELAGVLALTRSICADEPSFDGSLAGRFLGMMFHRPSTRTRTSFHRAALDLGFNVLSLDDNRTQLSTGETYADTGRVLGKYLDGIVVRTNGDIQNMRDLSVGCPALVNAMSSCEHPTQALTDYAALYRHFQKVEGVSIAYFGEGNNTVSALAKLFSTIPGCRLDLYMPSNYSLDAGTAETCSIRFRANGGRLNVLHEVPQELNRADVVYCTRWRTMGVGHPDPHWERHFLPFKMTQDLFERARTEVGVFMHDLPAVRGEDVVSAVLDGPHSIAWDQAYCKKIAAKAALIFSQVGIAGA